MNGSTSNACVASYRTTERPAAGEVRIVSRRAWPTASSVVDLKKVLLARDGLWPNAAPDERLWMWATNERLELQASRRRCGCRYLQGRRAARAQLRRHHQRRPRPRLRRPRARRTVLPKAYQQRGVHYFPPPNSR